MTSASVLNWNTIELHYWFNDESHTMNAIVLNKCEYEFLGIAKEIAQTLKVDLEIETEPLGEGGLRSWFKFKITAIIQPTYCFTSILIPN